ncbi:hypothetical protein [Spirosoma validum]|uniref:Outer membrane beta-barrel protein n=1 Tax=Spirosoma validum TaxID=2771355 RepID=A0A927GC81_9BACT|nr:hypothetical protein [Spirosoma validum]MBD2752186.1 hypothetical protein [Spirosoma validum]
MKRLLLYLIMAFSAGNASAQLFPQRPTYVNYTEVGGLFGRVLSGPSTTQIVENKVSLTAQTFNGVQLTQRVAVGGLVGIDWYKSALLMPVGAGIRYDLIRSEQNVRLLAVVDGGYGFAWLHTNSTGYDLKGGWMINPGIALRVGKPSSSAFVMSLTYKRQTADVQKPIGGNDIQRDEARIYNRMAIRLGVSF